MSFTSGELRLTILERKQPDVDEPGSNAYSVQMFKRLKMDQMTSDAGRAARVAGESVEVMPR